MQPLSTSPRGEHSQNPSSPWCRQIRSLSACTKCMRAMCEKRQSHFAVVHTGVTCLTRSRDDCASRTAWQADERNRSPCAFTGLQSRRQELSGHPKRVPACRLRDVNGGVGTRPSDMPVVHHYAGDLRLLGLWCHPVAMLQTL